MLFSFIILLTEYIVCFPGPWPFNLFFSFLLFFFWLGEGCMALTYKVVQTCALGQHAPPPSTHPPPPSPPTPRNAPCKHWYSSTLNCSWRMGSSIVGRLTNVVVPLSSWLYPAHFGLMSWRRFMMIWATKAMRAPWSYRGLVSTGPPCTERSGTTSAAASDALWCHALGKRRGYNAWYGCSVKPCVCMLNGCLKGL